MHAKKFGLKVFMASVITGMAMLSIFAMGPAALANPARASVAPGDTPRSMVLRKTTSASTKAALQHRSQLVDTIPYWSSLFTYQGGEYPYQMVGTDPSTGSATSHVKTAVIPLKFVFSDGSIFDGTSKLKATVDSPIWANGKFYTEKGKTQYGDAIQRAEFAQFVNNGSKHYHVLLDPPKTYKTITVVIPPDAGSTALNRHTNQPEGLIDINWLDPQIMSLITTLGIGPKTFPVFLSYNTFLYQGDPTQCCIIGYHSAIPYVEASGRSAIQTYAWSTYNDPGMFNAPIEDVNALSHEVAEWFNDPFVDNVTPNWISTFAPQYGCNNFLEAGDPLVGTVFVVNGYHLQDEAFYSWFAKQAPSLGYHGLYSYLGTFTSPGPLC